MGTAKVSINVSNVSVLEALDQCLKGLPLAYIIDDKNIIISKRLGQVSKQPRTRQITGTVANQQNQPLQGATVSVKGAAIVVTTDKNGNFQIGNLPNEEVTLVVTMIGYNTREIQVRVSVRDVTISLDEQVSNLDEVVVVGYGTQRRRDLTGAVSSVSAKQIQDIPTPSLDGALTAKMPGVQVSQTTGAPGGGISVKIRGTGSIGAGNEPLYVVDGFPITASYDQNSNPLNSLNTNDVSSIEVLKDASATAIYGSRGSNGVVIITTKSGRSGKMKIDLDMYTGIQQTTKYMDMMNSQEYASYIIDSRNNAWIDAGGNPSDPNSKRSAIYQILPVLQDPEALKQNTDWQREIFRTAPTQNAQVTFSGGNDKINYMTSAGYYKQEGIIINSNFSRYAFRVNLGAKASDKFKVGLNLAPTYSIRNPVSAEGHFSSGAVVLSALMMPPFLPVYNEDLHHRPRSGQRLQ
ncbi:TonB-linked outer membrane protein, SusC/RagA family [bacterium A37T11]|nr:TonB-linked outer membrane protein, SusC/RagA family [bacterium A37T11]